MRTDMKTIGHSDSTSMFLDMHLKLKLSQQQDTDQTVLAWSNLAAFDEQHSTGGILLFSADTVTCRPMRVGSYNDTAQIGHDYRRRFTIWILPKE